jgi:hypothetical protein
MHYCHEHASLAASGVVVEAELVRADGEIARRGIKISTRFDVVVAEVDDRQIATATILTVLVKFLDLVRAFSTYSGS